MRTPDRVRLGAVGYLNARPLVRGLDRMTRFEVRFDVPSRCAALLHDGDIDVGLIPSIEYLRAPTDRLEAHREQAGRGSSGEYRIVPDLAIASCGPVASVALYTTRPIAEVRSIALDTSSRTSVALVRVLCARLFGIEPSFEMCGPGIGAMLEQCDAALMIGDNALLLDHDHFRLESSAGHRAVTGGAATASAIGGGAAALTRIGKIDLGEAWTGMTGLPFVWAFWAGRAGALTAADVRVLREARDAGIACPEAVAREYFSTPAEQRLGARYLRDNIKYHLGDAERAGVALFYRYAAEIGLVEEAGELRFY